MIATAIIDQKNKKVAIHDVRSDREKNPEKFKISFVIGCVGWRRPMLNYIVNVKMNTIPSLIASMNLLDRPSTH